MHPAPVAPEPPDLLRRLQSLCRGTGLDNLGARLAELADLAGSDLARVEAGMPRVSADASTIEHGAEHLLEQGGKRLRPLCVALASRIGTGFDERACQLAIAVELVHAATLLHDDVVDLGETRRGAPASRMIFGNAASIFAGDWLLVDALRRVRKAGPDDLLGRLLDTIERMIIAESLQLDRRGKLDTTVGQWLDIVEGKTAALFGWALYAGGRAGGLDPEHCETLEVFGSHLGVAFQAIDDLLDLTGDPDKTGKALFTDLREGKLTYPLLLSIEREPAFADLVDRLSRAETVSSDEYRQVLATLDRTGSLDDCRSLALERSALAKDAVATLPPSRARDALMTVADATVHRPA